MPSDRGSRRTTPDGTGTRHGGSAHEAADGGGPRRPRRAAPRGWRRSGSARRRPRRAGGLLEVAVPQRPTGRAPVIEVARAFMAGWGARLPISVSRVAVSRTLRPTGGDRASRPDRASSFQGSAAVSTSAARAATTCWIRRGEVHHRGSPGTLRRSRWGVTRWLPARDTNGAGWDGVPRSPRSQRRRPGRVGRGAVFGDRLAMLGAEQLAVVGVRTALHPGREGGESPRGRARLVRVEGVRNYGCGERAG